MSNAAVFQYLNPILIGIVAANVQGATQPLLATHALNIWSFLVATLVYCFALEAKDVVTGSPGPQQNQANSCTHFWSFVAFVHGSVSSVSLVSTFVSRSAGYIILCIAWPFAAISIVVYQYGSSILDGFRWLYHEILKPFFIRTWNRIKGGNKNNMLSETEHPRTQASV